MGLDKYFMKKDGKTIQDYNDVKNIFYPPIENVEKVNDMTLKITIVDKPAIRRMPFELSLYEAMDDLGYKPVETPLKKDKKE